MKGMIKTKEDIKLIQEGGSHLARILERLEEMVIPGSKTGEIDKEAERMIKAVSGRPSFLGYAPRGVTPFNSTICACINEEVVHAPAHPSRELQEGDIFSIDIGMEYKGRFTDMAVTLAVGSISDEAKLLIDATKKSFKAGLDSIQPGGTIRDIGRAIYESAQQGGYGVVRALVGHGVGYAVHEDPQVPNYDDKRGDKINLDPGMVIAIEPMITIGAYEVDVLEDGWTIVTRDRSLAAHWEHTIVVTDNGYDILTN